MYNQKMNANKSKNRLTDIDKNNKLKCRSR